MPFNCINEILLKHDLLFAVPILNWVKSVTRNVFYRQIQATFPKKNIGLKFRPKSLFRFARRILLWCPIIVKKFLYTN